MKNLLTTSLLLFLLFESKAQTVPHVLDSLLSRTLDSMRTVLNVKSLSAAMQLPDDAIWAHAQGISSIGPTVNVTTDDVYLIGSVAKTITSACILQLADEQILNLDDSLYQWLDTIPNINPNITIRQLLRHQSGLYDALTNPNCQPALLANPDSIWAAEDLINTFIDAPLFQAGASWSYSNTNYFLLGMIIEQATGNPFYEEIRTRFFTPLGMNTAAIPAFEPLNSPVAHVWMDLNGDGIIEDGHNFYFNWLSLNSAAGAAGGYYATPTDIAHWTKTYLKGELLSPGMLAQAETTVSAPGLPGATYGLGLMKKVFYGYQGYGHGGDLAYSASSWYFPAKDVSITVFTNDARNNSWTLVPVVTALLKTCINYEASINPVAELDKSGIAMNIFPNPFDDNLTVALNAVENISTLKFVLTDIMGATIKEVKKYNISAGDNFVQFDNLNGLPSGMYFISAYTEAGNLIKTLKVAK